ncbi:MAG: sigma-70 family RNA polymerase sigma factor [Eubacterium sp.]|nr:sigma-70 family RNA polymerase sigma factor [Eubacterium sp.]
MSIQIKRLDGTLGVFENAEYLTAFYSIPRELLEKACPDLLKVSRFPAQITRDWTQIELVESDRFKQAIIEIYAYMVWTYLGISPYKEIYSGYDPLYKLAHQPDYWIKTMIDEKIIMDSHTVLSLLMDTPQIFFEFTSLEQMGGVMKYTVDKTIEKLNLKPVIECIQQNRCWEDFDARDSKQKTDFFRKWYHSRTAHPMISLEQYQEDYAERNNGKEFDIPDGTDVEDEAVTQELIDSFMKELTEKQKQILNLRLEGRTYEEIAEQVGYKTHSAVVKQMDKIGQKFETFAEVDYGFNERAQRRKASAKK